MITMKEKDTQSVRISKDILQNIRKVATHKGQHIRATIDNLLNEGINLFIFDIKYNQLRKLKGKDMENAEENKVLKNKLVNLK